MKMDRREFIKGVKDVVTAIPSGKVLTYGDVAALAGEPTQSRLVGRILGAMGFASEVPCHRVVNFQGRTAPHWQNQTALLRAEGVTFLPSGLVDMSTHHWHPEIDLN